MKYAIIDIGSSIIKYKIYSYENNIIEPIIINDESVGLISYRQDDKLTEKGIKILVNILEKFKNYSNKLNVEKSYYVATASLRNLNNTDEVLNIVKEKLDIEIKILTEIEEADYSFNSINTIQTPSNKGILIDIGGGSSEITIFEDKKSVKQKSIPTGVLKLYYEYVSLIYPTKEEQMMIKEDVKNKLKKLEIGEYDLEYLYGIGRTFNVIKKLLEHMNIKKDNTNSIDIKHVDVILKQLNENTKEKYKPLLQIDSERIHTILPSLLITKTVAEEFNIKKIYVCNTTLQDGIIYKLLND